MATLMTGVPILTEQPERDQSVKLKLATKGCNMVIGYNPDRIPYGDRGVLGRVEHDVLQVLVDLTVSI